MEKIEFILLRGLGRESRHWGEFAAKLKMKFPQCRVITYDLPGMGTRYAESSPITIEGITQRIPWEDEQIPPGGKRILIGLSLGGMVALQKISDDPSYFSGAVVVNSSVRGGTSILKRLKPKAAFALLQCLFKRKVWDREKIVIEVISNRRPISHSILEQWVQIQKSHPVRWSNIGRQLLAAATFSLSAQSSGIPVLVLASARDLFVDPKNSYSIAQNMGADIFLHPSSGHDLALDDADWMIEKIGIWLIERSILPR